MKTQPKGLVSAQGKNLSTYKFDTSQYVVLKTGVKRDAATGHFTLNKAQGSKKK